MISYDNVQVEQSNIQQILLGTMHRVKRIWQWVTRFLRLMQCFKVFRASHWGINPWIGHWVGCWETSGSDFLLVRHLFSVGIEEDQLILDKLESVSIFVLQNCLIGKHLEDLLHGGLTDTVLLDSQLWFVLLHESEQPSNSLVFLGNSELEVISTLFQ